MEIYDTPAVDPTPVSVEIDYIEAPTRDYGHRFVSDHKWGELIQLAEILDGCVAKNQSGIRDIAFYGNLNAHGNLESGEQAQRNILGPVGATPSLYDVWWCYRWASLFERHKGSESKVRELMKLTAEEMWGRMHLGHIAAMRERFTFHLCGSRFAASIYMKVAVDAEAGDKDARKLWAQWFRPRLVGQKQDEAPVDTEPDYINFGERELYDAITAEKHRLGLPIEGRFGGGAEEAPEVEEAP